MSITIRLPTGARVNSYDHPLSANHDSTSDNSCSDRKTCTLLVTSPFRFVFLLLLLFSSIVRADNIEQAGDLLMVAMPAAAGAIALMHHDTPGIFQFGESLALTGIVTLALKRSIDEERPDGGRYSFPSMHSAVVFNTAGFLYERYGWRWGVPAYTAAAFTGWSRIDSRRHFTHDVLAGAAIGIISSRLFTKPIHNYRTKVMYYGSHCTIAIWHE